MLFFEDALLVCNISLIKHRMNAHVVATNKDESNQLSKGLIDFIITKFLLLLNISFKNSLCLFKVSDRKKSEFSS